MHVAIVVFDGFDTLDAIGPFEVFHHARSFRGDIEVELSTLSPQNLVTSSHGLRIHPDGVLGAETDETSPRSPGSDGERPTVLDVVIVPGGNWLAHGDDGIRAQIERGDLPDVLTALHDEGVIVGSVCTGAMALASAGLTDGRPAVTHHGALEDLRESGADVIEARVVDDGDIVTAGGITAGIDLALHLIEREVDPDLADRVATLMEYEPQGTIYTE